MSEQRLRASLLEVVFEHADIRIQTQELEMTEVLLTVSEAAKRLSLGRTMLYELIAKGELPSLKIGRARRIPASALERWVVGQVIEDMKDENNLDAG
jgi:excisionase family DNA binding protein